MPMGDMADWQFDQGQLDELVYGPGGEYGEIDMATKAKVAEGLIGFIKTRKTAQGYLTYAITFDDRDDDRWFGCYKTDPEDKGAEVGSYVKFEYSKSGSGFLNIDMDTFEVIEDDDEEDEDDAEEEDDTEDEEDEEEEEAPPKKSKKKAAKKKATKKKASKKKSGGSSSRATAARAAAGFKDANIQWQSARNAALTFVGIAQEAGVLDLGTGKKGDKLEALDHFVNLKSLDFFTASLEVGETGEAPDIETGE